MSMNFVVSSSSRTVARISWPSNGASPIFPVSLYLVSPRYVSTFGQGGLRTIVEMVLFQPCLRRAADFGFGIACQLHEHCASGCALGALRAKVEGERET